MTGAALEVCEGQAAPPPPDELMLIVQVDPTAPGADALAQGMPSRGASNARRRAALAHLDLSACSSAVACVGSALRNLHPCKTTHVRKMSACEANLLDGRERSVEPQADEHSSATAGELAALGEYLRQEAPRPPNALLLQHHSGTSNAAATDAPLLPFPAPPAGDCMCPAAAQPGAGDGGTHAMAAPQAPKCSSALMSIPAGMLAPGVLTCKPGAEDTALGNSAEHVSIHDALGDLTFRISPSAFFQVPRPIRCNLPALPCGS